MAGDAARSSDLEEGEMAEDAAAMERPVLTPGITSALVRLFDHHDVAAPSQLTMT